MMNHPNRFAGALLGVALLGGLSAALVQPAGAQTDATPPAAPAAPAAPDTTTSPATPDATATPDTTSPSPSTPDTSATPMPDVTTDPPTSPTAVAIPTPDTFALPVIPMISSIPGHYAPAPTLSTGPINETVNYSALMYRNLDDIDLQIASTYHYSDRELAKILKLAKLTDTPFDAVLRQVRDGETFPTLCDKYGVGFGALKDVSKEMKQIADYESAVAATGTFSFKHDSVLGPAFYAPGSHGSVLAETPDLNQPLPVPVTH